MFEKRLTWFWILLTTLAAVIIGRLVQIQVAQASEYTALAERILTRRPQYLAAPRGTVFDRNGVCLLQDEPTSTVDLHFAVISRFAHPEDESKRLRKYLLRNVARAMRKRGDYPADMRLSEIADHLAQNDVPYVWQRLSELTGLTEDALRERAARVYNRIQAWRANSGPVREEHLLLPVVQDVDEDVALAVRLELETYPWIRARPASRRVAHDADAVVHLLGRLGAASPQRIASDPMRDDELCGLRSGDRCGISGVEKLAEQSLRGTRGRILSDYDWRLLERVDPQRGCNVYLTIDLELQREVLGFLREAVQGNPKAKPPGGLPKNHRSGAAAVVIDAKTREIVVLASYPTYDYNAFAEDYDRLRKDKYRDPLMFRAIRALYPPGSTCKAISVIAGLSEGVITPESTYTCNGHLLPNRPNMFKCWIYGDHGLTHGKQVAELAIRNSCNIFFFKVGGLLGPGRLCEWFQRFGLGRTQGTGLIEESPGIVPTGDWLSSPQRANPRRYRKSDAWNFAIGQGEVTATPLQVANVAATAATGYWAPVRLAYDTAGHALGTEPAPVEHFNENHMRLLRKGMYRVVNDRPGGTAPRARLELPGFELCGKTGSAQTVRRVIRKRYVCQWPDGRRESVVATSRHDALAKFRGEKPKVVSSRAVELYPWLEEGEKLPAHAWFMGYTQTATGKPDGSLPTGPVYALSVIIEYGGSGGRVAGPVAKRIAEAVLQHEVGTETSGTQ